MKKNHPRHIATVGHNYTDSPSSAPRKSVATAFNLSLFLSDLSKSDNANAWPDWLVVRSQRKYVREGSVESFGLDHEIPDELDHILAYEVEPRGYDVLRKLSNTATYALSENDSVALVKFQALHFARQKKNVERAKSLSKENTMHELLEKLALKIDKEGWFKEVDTPLQNARQKIAQGEEFSGDRKWSWFIVGDYMYWVEELLKYKSYAISTQSDQRLQKMPSLPGMIYSLNRSTDKQTRARIRSEFRRFCFSRLFSRMQQSRELFGPLHRRFPFLWCFLSGGPARLLDNFYATSISLDKFILFTNSENQLFLKALSFWMHSSRAYQRLSIQQEMGSIIGADENSIRDTYQLVTEIQFQEAMRVLRAVKP